MDVKEIAQGTERIRGGPVRGSNKRLLASPTVDMSAPTDHVQGISLAGFQECYWLVVCPSWCTAYDFHVGRFVSVAGPLPSKLAAYEGWVEVDSQETVDVSLEYFQPIVGDVLYAWVDNIAGVADPAEPFRIIYAGVNRTS